MPFMCGSTSPRAALTATAASIALPPAFRMSMPTCAASGWLAATIPCGAMTSERLLCGLRARPAVAVAQRLLRLGAHRDVRAENGNPKHRGHRHQGNPITPQHRIPGLQPHCHNSLLQGLMADRRGP